MIYDIGVIGAGPSGLFVPFIAGMKKLSCVVFESLDFIGGQCSALYPEKPIYDIPGIPSILAADLINNLSAQIQRFDPQINLSEGVIGYEKKDDFFLLNTSKGKEFKVKSIVIASGGGRFGPNRPNLTGIIEYEEKSVFYSIKSKEIFRGKNVAIAGGGDSAVDWAIALCDIANRVYFIHRRNKFKASMESIATLEEIAQNSNKFEFVIPFQLESLSGKDGILETLTVAMLSGEKRTLEVDVLLPFFGLSTDSSLINTFGIETLNGLAKVTPQTMQTNIEGIYAVGDIANYEKKIKLIFTAFSEVASCVYDIKAKLYPNVIEKFEYSTSVFAEK